MKCMKCGREIGDESVFCKSCLGVMDQYPIKPGTVIQLPRRKITPRKKTRSRKRALPPEELVLQQKKTIRWLWVALISTVLLLCLSIVLLLHTDGNGEAVATIGQNYITRDSR